MIAYSYQSYRQQRRVHLRSVGDHDPPQILRTSAVDTFVLRSDSLKATKRRSWAHIDPTTRSTPATATQAALAAAAAATHVAPAVASTAAATSITTNGAPRRVVVAPATAVVAPSLAPPPVVATVTAQQPAKQKQRKNISFSALFGRRSTSKESKKLAAAVISAPIVEHTPAEIQKQTSLSVALSVERPPPSIRPAHSTTRIDTKPPRAAIPPSPNKTTVAPSPPRCPLAAADEDAGDSSLDEPSIGSATVHSPTPQLSTSSPSRQIEPRESNESSECASSASPPEDPPQNARDHDDEASVSSATTVDDIEHPSSTLVAAAPASTSGVISTSATSISEDERRMLAATNEIMRQLNELDTDTALATSKEPPQPASTAIAATNGDDEDETTLVNADDDVEENETTLSCQQLVPMGYDGEGHGVQIEPYIVERQIERDEDEDEERQTTTEEASSNDSDASSANGEPQFDVIARPSTLRSCIKGINEPRPRGRRMIFDPLVIFLDAALEGELDLVKANAAKVRLLSTSSDVHHISSDCRHFAGQRRRYHCSPQCHLRWPYRHCSLPHRTTCRRQRTGEPSSRCSLLDNSWMSI